MGIHAAMQVADRCYTFSMLDDAELRRMIELERPDYIVPVIEAISTDTLVRLEQEGFTVFPTARAAHLTMNREVIRRLAAWELGMPTSAYRFVDNREDFKKAVSEVCIHCVVNDHEFFG